MRRDDLRRDRAALATVEVTVDEPPPEVVDERPVTNGQAEPQFKVMTGFVILESNDGGIWLAEQIR